MVKELLRTIPHATIRQQAVGRWCIWVPSHLQPLIDFPVVFCHAERRRTSLAVLFRKVEKSYTCKFFTNCHAPARVGTKIIFAYFFWHWNINKIKVLRLWRDIQDFFRLRMSHLRLPQTMHEPPSSLLRVAQQFALEHSERRTSYIGRFSWRIEGKSF